PTPCIRSKRPSPSRPSSPSISSTGNLFGTTRSDHPGWLAPLPFRYARTSGGVLLSLPAQKGQNRPEGVVVADYLTKSAGRPARSGAVRTHRRGIRAFTE